MQIVSIQLTIPKARFILKTVWNKYVKTVRTFTLKWFVKSVKFENKKIKNLKGNKFFVFIFASSPTYLKRLFQPLCGSFDCCEKKKDFLDFFDFLSADPILLI